MGRTFVTRNFTKRNFVARSFVKRAYSSTYDADATAFFARTPTQYDTAHKVAISNFIAGLKSDASVSSLATICDLKYFIGSPTADDALINAVSSSFNGTPINSPPFNANQGYAGDSVAACISTNYNPSVNNSAISLNNSSFAIYIRNNVAENATDVGADDSVFNIWYLQSQKTNNTSIIGLNDSYSSPGSVSTSVGLFHVIRSGSGGVSLYQNGILIGTTTDVSVALTNMVIYLLALNYFGAGALQFSSKQISYFTVLNTSVTPANLWTRFQTLQTAFGW